MVCRFLGRGLWRALCGAFAIRQQRGGEFLVLWKGTSASLGRLLERHRWPLVLSPYRQLLIAFMVAGFSTVKILLVSLQDLWKVETSGNRTLIVKIIRAKTLSLGYYSKQECSDIRNGV